MNLAFRHARRAWPALQLPDFASCLSSRRRPRRNSLGGLKRCTRSIRCSVPATATRSASRWPSSASPISSSRSTSSRRKPHAGIPRQESERAGAAARGRARPLPRRIKRHPLVRRRRHDARAGRPHRARRGAAMDVLRAAQPGAQYRRRLFLAGADQGRARIAAARARGLDGERLSRARRDGDASRQHRFFAADRYTIADIALYAYTHLAHQCDFDLARFPAVRAWLAASPPSPATSPWTGSRSIAARSSAGIAKAFGSLATKTPRFGNRLRPNRVEPLPRGAL